MTRILPLPLASFANMSWAEGETIDVKYRGPVDLKPFKW